MILHFLNMFYYLNIIKIDIFYMFKLNTKHVNIYKKKRAKDAIIVLLSLSFYFLLKKFHFCQWKI